MSVSRDDALPEAQGLITALTGLLSQLEGRLYVRQIVLSDALVHPVIIPWPWSPVGSAEWSGLAQAALIDRYGSEAAGWSVRFAFARFGARGLALGISGELMRGLVAACRSHKAGVGSIQANLIRAMDRHQLWRVAHEELLVCSDGCSLAIATRDIQDWRSIRCIAYGLSDQGWIASLIEREIATSGLAAPKLVIVGLPATTIPEQWRSHATHYPPAIDLRQLEVNAA